jgi:hypothetical protein
MKFTKTFLFSILLIISCQTNPSKKTETADSSKTRDRLIENERSKEFTRFLNKFKSLELPLTINPDEQKEIRNLPLLFGTDTAFISTAYKDTSLDKVFAYGLLPDTAKSFKVIWLTPTEIYLPVLTTFSKDGKKISEQELSVGQCGSDCCFTCVETIKINMDMAIYSADSISRCDCDSIGPKENTMKKFVLFKTGKIYGDGKISLSEMKERKE